MNRYISFVLFQSIIYLLSCFEITDAKAVDLTENNFDQHVANNELVFLNFYADWCRFSQILGPIFNEAAETIAKEFAPGKVLFGKVDSVAETNLAQRFKISKYPTLKLIRNGKLMKREYRGQRSLEALIEHVRDLMKDPVKELVTDEDIKNIDANKRKVIIYTPDKASPVYEIFLKVAMDLRDDCQFFIVKGPLGESSLHPEQKAKIIFNPTKSKVGVNDEEYVGALLSYDELSAWTTNRCIPLVREITFENAEELTEEGIPFLILFHHPDDSESPKLFTNAVQTQLLDDRTLVNFLIADGVKFAHPLHHLGKAQSDLPLIAIDSFRHMYLFPNFNDIHIPGKLKEFVLDLFSGKLHREFHYGPDPVTNNVISTNPPESTFRKLAPSRNRYTLLRDEL
ncbi:endoplasmic reticulum resident protein 44 [Trichonephila inaurata madagascariensis]|uniref:Endoplasmic reticulum resident protein 44 n=1 Tax=Trichonephila inaurata madagascariensis TaxID=2747483 RepID=A0A8X6X129_9ARAC|nr:endoplasmic reticulum resident protein 44 [Trichonephila inaurata madagascariensis]